MTRKTALKEILKRLQGINKQFRHQIRLGTQDLELYMRNYQEFNWKPYRKIDIDSIDSNDVIPKWDLTIKADKANKIDINPFDCKKQPGERGPVESPEARINKRKKTLMTGRYASFCGHFWKEPKLPPTTRIYLWRKQRMSKRRNNMKLKERILKTQRKKIWKIR